MPIVADVRLTFGNRNSCACGGIRHLRDGETGKFYECDCLRIERRWRAFEAAGIPREYWEVDVGHFPRADWFEAARMHTADLTRALAEGTGYPPGLFIVGDNATGKALVAALVARRFVLEGKSALLVRMQKVVRDYFGEVEEKVNLLAPECLGLHLGEEVRNRTSGPLFLDLYWERRARGRYTFVTWSGEDRELETRYGKDAAALLRDSRAFTRLSADE